MLSVRGKRPSMQKWFEGWQRISSWIRSWPRGKNARSDVFHSRRRWSREQWHGRNHTGKRRMSRIHEAVKKAIWEQQAGAAPVMSSAESVLSASYTLNAAVSSEPVGALRADYPPHQSGLLQSIPVPEWMPDKKRMLFF